MRDLICNVMYYCASSSAVGNIKCINDQIVIKNLKSVRDENRTTFYTNFHLKDNLRMEFVV